VTIKKRQGVDMMKKIVMIGLVLLLLLVGLKHFNHYQNTTKVDASSPKESQMVVRHFVKQDTLFIECFIPSVTFTDKSSHVKRAKIRVYVDGQMKGDYNTAAFVLKGMQRGVHLVKLDVLDRKSSHQLGMHRQFYITVS